MNRSNRFPMPPPPPEIPVAAAEPYPSPSVERANPAYARLLMGDLASGKGEMTAIYEYIYQSWILEPGYEELAATLVRIAEVEMKHLRILGELIFQLGGDPKCFSPTSRGYFPWNGGMPGYHRDARGILTSNALLELSAIDAYTAHAQAIQDEKVSALLLRLMQDEVVHKGIFENYLTRLLE